MDIPISWILAEYQISDGTHRQMLCCSSFIHPLQQTATYQPKFSKRFCGCWDRGSWTYINPVIWVLVWYLTGKVFFRKKKNKKPSASGSILNVFFFFFHRSHCWSQVKYMLCVHIWDIMNCLPLCKWQGHRDVLLINFL